MKITETRQAISPNPIGFANLQKRRYVSGMPNPYLTLVESWKDLPPIVSWSEPDPTDGEMTIFAPLEIGNVTVGSFALRAACYVDRLESDVRFQLETGLPGQRTRLPLTRIDWRPISGGHKQPKKPDGGKRLIIKGSHFHTLEDNWLEREQRMRENNLPYAQALESDPANFQELLDLVKIRFRINNITSIGTPKWAAKL